MNEPNLRAHERANPYEFYYSYFWLANVTVLPSRGEMGPKMEPCGIRAMCLGVARLR